MVAVVKVMVIVLVVEVVVVVGVSTRKRVGSPHFWPLYIPMFLRLGLGFA